MEIFETRGVCSREIGVEVENNIITDVKFFGGCDGNTKGLSKLLVGMNVDDVITKLSGITCGHKMTSCPDQLAQILREHYKK